ncbi:hypothetical protein FVD38_13905 [Massilia arenae]|uniref:DUF2892 domain-containing protein n=2 Tax=Massilia arenae TaxID=2603288 RepID=A0A5C7G553_9BURK|nr:hypothetical protein FVD38_13905 [Massilia arenae]
MMFAATATQVSGHTSPQLNDQIRHETQERIREYERNDRNALITRRLNELEHEWDVERTLQTNFATLSLVGLALALKSDKRWLVLAAGVPLFMVQHALQGWCPPLPVLRRLGVRTAREIAEERYALKSLRGDFDDVDGAKDPDAIVRAVRA